MSINGCTRTCGLIGNPVEHTMSPAIHNTLVYVPFHVQPELVGKAVEGAYALNLLGCNVTVPYKSQVIPYLKEIDPLAERIGAVNTLVRTEGGFKGYNTDMPGLARALKADEVNAAAGSKIAGALSVSDYGKLSAGRRYLAIQATNVGMFPRVDEAVIEDRDFYKRIHTGYDLIFNPVRTRFMELTREAGGKACNGLKMLLYQGVIAYELWTGTRVTKDMEEQAYRALKQAMKV